MCKMCFTNRPSNVSPGTEMWKNSDTETERKKNQINACEMNGRLNRKSNGNDFLMETDGRNGSFDIMVK